MLDKIALGIALAMCTASALTQSREIRAPAAGSAYLQDSRGMIVRSGTGLCWRLGHWTPADAVTGCDGELLPPVVRPTAPEIAPPSLVQAPPAAVGPMAAPAPQRCDFTVTLQSDETFAFNQARLTAAARQRLRQDLAARLDNCSNVEAVTITGHADRIGSPSYNQKLSERRAQAVAAFLKDAGVAAEMETIGAGETHPIQACDRTLRRTQLIRCLAPNRRVVIEVSGLAP